MLTTVVMLEVATDDDDLSETDVYVPSCGRNSDQHDADSGLRFKRQQYYIACVDGDRLQVREWASISCLPRRLSVSPLRVSGASC